MGNIYWMYDNKLEKADRLRPSYTVLSGGTADICDFNLETQYKGTCALGTHNLTAFFDGTGICCNSAILVSDTAMIGTFRVAWGTTLGGVWDSASVAIHPTGTTLLTWAGTLVYVKQFMLRWFLDIKNDATANQIFLGKYLQLASNPIYPVTREEQKSVTIGETPKGVRHIYHNFDRKSWTFQYEGISTADKDNIKDMVDYCHGPYKPLWFTLNPSEPEKTEFVRFATDRFSYEEIVSGFWRVTLPLEQEL